MEDYIKLNTVQGDTNFSAILFKSRSSSCTINERYIQFIRKLIFITNEISRR